MARRRIGQERFEFSTGGSERKTSSLDELAEVIDMLDSAT